MISTKTRVMLWGRAAGRCSLPDCRRALVLDETETDDPSLVGEACHIVAESESGPRGVSALTREERDKYGNLILMCAVHHKMIDDQPNHFSVPVLHTMKATHEQFVGESFDANSRRTLMDRETIAGYVDYWMYACDVNDWNAWTSGLFSPETMITKERLEALEALPQWVISRIWPPEGFTRIQSAMKNFGRTANGFSMTYNKHSEPFQNDGQIREYRTKRFYNIDAWDEALHRSLVMQYEQHTALISDYALELTRAANHICDSVRLELLPSFRIREGHLLVTSGPDMNLRFATYKPEYLPTDHPSLYGGEEDFNTKRLSRDFHFGTEGEAQILGIQYKQRREMFS